MSRDENAGKLREMNLSKLFGNQAFERIVCLDTGADKHEALEEYKDSGCWWLEDKPVFYSLYPAVLQLCSFRFRCDKNLQQRQR